MTGLFSTLEDLLPLSSFFGFLGFCFLGRLVGFFGLRHRGVAFRRVGRNGGERNGCENRSNQRREKLAHFFPILCKVIDL